MIKRITDAQLGPSFVNGQTLFDSDLNKIVEVLKAGVNANKDDLNAIITGNYDMLVFSDALFSDINNVGQNGDFAINIIDGKVELIHKEQGFWQTIDTISLMDLYDRIEDIDFNYKEITIDGGFL